MAAHRYWRLYLTSHVGPGGSVYGAAEIEMRSTVGGADLCSGGTVFARFFPADAPKAFDNDPATYWEPGSAEPNWIGYDFGAGNAHDIQEITWKPSNTTDPIGPGTIRVQASDDNVAWFDVWAVTGITGWAPSTTKTFTKVSDLESGLAVPHTYWKLNVLATISSNFCGLAEVQLRATVGGSDVTPGATATTDSVYGSNVAGNAIDDNTSTVWETTAETASHWLMLALASPSKVRELVLTAMGSWMQESPKDFEVLYSDDGSTWAIAAAYFGQPEWSANETRTFGIASLSLSVSSVSPSSGGVGTAATITGAGFTGTTGVTFGGVSATGLTVVSDTEIECTTPAHAPGAVDVVVTTPAGSATLVGGFTYLDPFRIDSVTPSVAYRGGGSSVTIAGAGYVGGAQVLIDGRPATVTSLTATEIVATVPAAPAAGAVTLKVRLPDNTERTAAFTYEDHAVTSVSPTTLPQAGGALQVNGRYFLSGASVLVDGAPVSTTFTSATELHATIPAGLALGLHDVAVANGTRGTTPALADAFLTVAPASSGSTVLFVVT